MPESTIDSAVSSVKDVIANSFGDILGSLTPFLITIGVAGLVFFLIKLLLLKAKEVFDNSAGNKRKGRRKYYYHKKGYYYRGNVGYVTNNSYSRPAQRKHKTDWSVVVKYDEWYVIKFT